MEVVPIILAGGFGTRLWPISRKQHPKQFVRLIGKQTLFQQTLNRIPNLLDTKPIIICNDKHYNLVTDQLQSIGIDKVQLILEPIGKNTAPAVAIAALRLLAQGLDHIMLILPADHIIADVPKFHDGISVAKKYAEKNLLVCFGIIPNFPETGYGYIEFGKKLENNNAYNISKFVEKPNLELAKQYIDSGKYYWNSGMFMFRASVYLKELKRNAPDIYKVCKEIVDANKKSSKASNDKVFKIAAEKFSICPSDSIDYAIMENSKNAVVVPLDIDWSDLGSWQALWEYGKKDSADNVIVGDVIIKNMENSYVHATERKVVALGITDCVIVETHDVVLVVSKKHCQAIKSIIDLLPKKCS